MTQTKIATVEAWPLAVPISFSVRSGTKGGVLSALVTRITTEDGRAGTGFTAITDEEIVAAGIDKVAGPALIGENPLATERLWEKLYWILSPRGQGGYASHIIAALDVALWDLKGRILSQPVWRLLGGAHAEVPAYATFGMSFFDKDELADVARHWVGQGFTGLKMVVGHRALEKRQGGASLRAIVLEDIARIRAVREAVGPDIDIAVDANCSLDYEHARMLVEKARPLHLHAFEEPVADNEIEALKALRAVPGCPLVTVGQNEGQLFRFRDFLAHRAADVVQPNVVISGGYTQALRVAALARAFGGGLSNGGAWSHFNMHLLAGVANGGPIEWHLGAVEVCRPLFKNTPEPSAGKLRLPEGPGLGFEPDLESIRELAKRGGAGGTGKG